MVTTLGARGTTGQVPSDRGGAAKCSHRRVWWLQMGWAVNLFGVLMCYSDAVSVSLYIRGFTDTRFQGPTWSFLATDGVWLEWLGRLSWLSAPMETRDVAGGLRIPIRAL